MKTAIILLGLFLIIAAIPLSLAGLYLLAGLGWALIYGGILAAIAGLVMLRGIGKL